LDISFEEIKKFYDKNIIFIIDGLNENEQALNILSKIHNEVSQPSKSNVKFIVSVRTEFWNNISSTTRGIEIIKKSSFFVNQQKVPKFSDRELKDAVVKFNIESNMSSIKSKKLKELLKSPLYLKLISQAKITHISTTLDIFEQFYDKEIAISEKYVSVIEELCELFYERKSIEIKGFRAYLEREINPELNESYEELNNKQILKDIRKKATTFFYDKMGEYLFAKLYLTQLAKESTLESFLDTMIQEIKATEKLSFKIFLVNALRYFLALLEMKDIQHCIASKNLAIRTLTKEALSEKRKLIFKQEYLSDPFLFSIMLLDSENYHALFNHLIGHENLYLSHSPINILSTREPYVLKEFILFIMASIPTTAVEQRNALILLLNALLVYVMKNGINESDSEMFVAFKKLMTNYDSSYMASVIENVLAENIKYLLYNAHNTTVNELFEMDNKLLLQKALASSVFDLDFGDIKYLIINNMSSWLVTMMLFFRDREDERFNPTLQALFETEEEGYQDFVITVLGHLSKFDTQFLNLLKDFTYTMKNDYPTIYNAIAIKNDDEKESQYDPMVPLISSNIFYTQQDDESSLETIFMELAYVKDENDANNLHRLILKIALDYPYIALQTIYEKEILEDANFIHHKNKIIEILNAIRYFYPDIFWEETKKYRLDSITLFLEEHEKFDLNTTNRIHDWHWFNIFNFIFSNDTNEFNLLIEKMLKQNSFYEFIKEELSYS
jgi:hypothetical protein